MSNAVLQRSPLEVPTRAPRVRPLSSALKGLRHFREFGAESVESLTEVSLSDGSLAQIPTLTNEYWTARQRASNSLHEISYRACFKAQLPRFFIERFTETGNVVYDPFMGRGTAVLESALLGRRSAGCDINPLSAMIVGPRLLPPSIDEVAARLAKIDFTRSRDLPEELMVFFHRETLGQICALRSYLREKDAAGALDSTDRWIRMVALNRLTGHSPGFFSVYTLPPNQAVSVEAQRKINVKRNQTPPERDVRALIVKKSASLLEDCDAMCRICLTGGKKPFLLTGDAESTPQLPAESIHLVVTSPPFLDVVDYAADNWLRCWFAGIDTETVPLALFRRIEEWEEKMTRVFRELRRVLCPGGHVAFEVGEVRGGKLLLEHAVVRAAFAAELEPLAVVINSQKFTKTANCWGVSNNSKGTNTNRIVLLRKE